NPHGRARRRQRSHVAHRRPRPGAAARCRPRPHRQGRSEPRAGGPRAVTMLIDVHAHFWHERTPRADWDALNGRRLAAGDRVGITVHVASVLGSWGLTSPTYFMSPADLTFGND